MLTNCLRRFRLEKTFFFWCFRQSRSQEHRRESVLSLPSLQVYVFYGLITRGRMLFLKFRFNLFENFVLGAWRTESGEGGHVFPLIRVVHQWIRGYPEESCFWRGEKALNRFYTFSLVSLPSEISDGRNRWNKKSLSSDILRSERIWICDNLGYSRSRSQWNFLNQRTFKAIGCDLAKWIAKS